MRDVTILFPMKQGKILLGMKKRGFGVEKINGFGGKVGEGESIMQAAVRELYEEVGLKTEESHLRKVGEIEFFFPESKAQKWNQRAHIFMLETWQGIPKESEEMTCEWFDIEKVPFEKMWDTDQHWLPHILEGKRIRAKFHFNEDTETTKSFNIEETSDF